jgi:SAM-dependent methyltransferase
MLFSSSSRSLSELDHHVARLARVFDVKPIAEQRMSTEEVSSYFELSFGAYRRRFSHEGALHLALNADGRYDEAGFTGQLGRLREVWAGQPAAEVLELGFGHGYNLATLAPLLPDTRFCGLDLTHRHVQHVQGMLTERGISNATAVQGDFHHLPWPDECFDHAYSIEVFCYVLDMPRALSEVARVLRPGGTLTLIDGFLTRPLSAMSEGDALATRLATKGMAIDSQPVLSELLERAEAAGLQLARRTELATEVSPHLHVLERRAAAFLRWPWLARRLLARLNEVTMRNVLSAYLMRPMMTQGLWTYDELVLRKPAS